MNPYMVGIFVILVVGSSFVQVLKLFQTTPTVPKDEQVAVAMDVLWLWDDNGMEFET